MICLLPPPPPSPYSLFPTPYSLLPTPYSLPAPLPPPLLPFYLKKLLGLLVSFALLFEEEY